MLPTGSGTTTGSNGSIANSKEATKQLRQRKRLLMLSHHNNNNNNNNNNNILRHGISVLLLFVLTIIRSTCSFTFDTHSCQQQRCRHGHSKDHMFLQLPQQQTQRRTRMTNAQYPRLFAKAGSTGSRSKSSNSINKTKKGFGSSSSSSSTSTNDATIDRSDSSIATVSTVQSTGTPPTVVVSKKEREAMMQQLQKQYGGITPGEIAMGTQQKMAEYVQQLPSHIQAAIQLYTKLQQYNTTVSKLSIYQQTQMLTNNRQQFDLMQMDQRQLNDIYVTHNLCNIDIHNILQQMTWDTSAYAKVVKSQLGTMNHDIAQRITKACTYIIDAVTMSVGTNPIGRCLDVGCGYGALIPILTTTMPTTGSTGGGTIQQSQIYGIDISTEMIKYGQELYPSCHFMSSDFLKYSPSSNNVNKDDEYSSNDEFFDGIMFCSSLHDMPNIYLVLEKAISLLRPTINSRIVIVHAQGAGHVQLQHTKNPILVPQLLPSAQELQSFIDTYNNKTNMDHSLTTTTTKATKLQLMVAPAEANTPADISDGYLAVIQRVEMFGTTDTTKR